MSDTELLLCPFCDDSDFDLVGPKSHLINGHCDTFEVIEAVSSPFAARVSVSPTVETIANAISKAAQAILDIAVRDNMQVPHKGTLEMIIRDFAVRPLLSPTEQNRNQAEDSKLRKK